MAAERDTVDRLIAAYLSEQVDRTFEARVSGVTKSGLFVQLPQYGADGFIPVSSLHDDYYHFDEAARALFGDRSGKGYQLADKVEVKLVEVAPLAGAMRFEMLSEPKPLPGSKRSFHKSKAGRKTRERASQPRGRTRR
jgi:ribonuclease R